MGQFDWRSRRYARLCFLLLCSPIGAWAGPFDSITMQGSVAALGATGSRDLDGSGARAGAAARVNIDAAGSIGKGHLEAAAYGPDLGQEPATTVRQAYWSVDAGDVRVRAGRQIIAWGRADRLNPSDNLSPHNRRALVTDVDEERIGTDTLSLAWNLSPSWSLNALWTPHMPASAIPRDVARLFTGAGLRPSAPERTLAYKLDYSGNGLDGSISMVDGPSLLPVLVFDGNAVAVRRPSYRILASDFSWQFAGSWGMRGEFAGTRFDASAQKVPQDFGVANFRYSVIGLEHQLDGGWTAMAQIAIRRASSLGITPALPPLAQFNQAVWFQSRGHDNALLMSITKNPFDENWSGDAGVLRSFTGKDWGVFLRAEWRIDDTYSLRFRHEIFRGERDTNLGALRSNSVSMLELRATWGR